MAGTLHILYLRAYGVVRRFVVYVAGTVVGVQLNCDLTRASAILACEALIRRWIESIRESAMRHNLLRRVHRAYDNGSETQIYFALE